MDLEGKVIQRRELYYVENNKARHVKDWPTFVDMCNAKGLDMGARVYVDEVNMPPFGKPIKDWPEVITPVPPVSIRKWTIAGTCMNRPDWYSDLGYMKFTHVYSNKDCGMDWGILNNMGIKVIMTITGYSTNKWKQFVVDNMHNPVCGGYWHDDLGHEPDMLHPEQWESRLQLRKDFYKAVRAIDPDITNHPVMEMMDNTGHEDFQNPDGSYIYPGWKLAYCPEAHDLCLADIYPHATNAANMTIQMERSWNKFISIYNKKQMIIQMCAYGNGYWPGYIRTQYNYWKDKLGPMGTCFYKQSTMMDSSAMREEIRKVNLEVLNG